MPGLGHGRAPLRPQRFFNTPRTVVGASADLAGSYDGVSAWSGALSPGASLAGVYAGVSSWAATSISEVQDLAGSFAGASVWSGLRVSEVQDLVGSYGGLSAWSALRLVEPQALAAAYVALSAWGGALTPGAAAGAALVAAYGGVSRWSGVLAAAHKKGDWGTLLRLMAEEHHRKVGPPKRPPDSRRQPQKERVLAKSLHRDLVDRYGPDEGRQVYRKMQAEQKGPFKPGAKYGPKVKR